LSYYPKLPLKAILEDWGILLFRIVARTGRLIGPKNISKYSLPIFDFPKVSVTIFA
jgi:hypothetical protein